MNRRLPYYGVSILANLPPAIFYYEPTTETVLVTTLLKSEFVRSCCCWKMFCEHTSTTQVSFLHLKE